jgi:hypothetical protein
MQLLNTTVDAVALFVDMSGGELIYFLRYNRLLRLHRVYTCLARGMRLFLSQQVGSVVHVAYLLSKSQLFIPFFVFVCVECACFCRNR